jgi:predicted Zn finger-like uncharacterized protein
MKIVCPSCEANYQVPEAVLDSRRQVRCARCGNSWVPGDQPRLQDDGEPVAAVVEAPASAAPAQEPVVEAEAAAAIPAVAEPVQAPVAVIEAVAPPEAAPAPAVAPLRQRAASALDSETAAAEPAPPVVQTADEPTGAPLSAWIASILVLVAIIVAGVVFRDVIMNIWPASQRVYAAIGLYHP